MSKTCIREEDGNIAARIDVAQDNAPEDLVIRNTNVVNVFLQTVELRNLAVPCDCMTRLYPP